MRNPVKTVLLCLFSLLSLLPVLAADLKTYSDVYQKNTEEIRQTFQPKFDDLQKQYQKSLETLKANAQSRGDFKTTKAAKTELERFQKSKTLPPVTDENETPEIKAFQASYVQQYIKLEKDQTAELCLLTTKYEQALDRLQKELGKTEKTDEATAVQAEQYKAQRTLKGYVDQMESLNDPHTANASPAEGESAANKEPVLRTQELMPELAAAAAKHKAADEAMDKQKQEAIALAAKSYVSALDSIEKSATTAGQLDLVAAVVKEREAVTSGSLEPELPSALPKAKLQMSRKTLLASLERINADFAKRKKQADADYLRFLATLQPKAATNPELAKQLAAEKTALLSGDSGVTAAGNGSQTVQKPLSKNVVVNGDFEKVVSGKPDGWKTPECADIVTENNNSFVRFKVEAIDNDGTADYYFVRQEIALPAGALTVTVSARLRTKDVKGGKTPVAQVGFINQDGKFFSCAAASGNGKDGPWQKIRAEMSVPKAAVKAFAEVLNARLSGQIDFDDVEVTFK